MYIAARPDQFVQTLTENLMTYALGRSVQYYDMPLVRKLVRDAAAQDYRFSSARAGHRHQPGVPDATGCRSTKPASRATAAQARGKR